MTVFAATLLAVPATSAVTAASTFVLPDAIVTWALVLNKTCVPEAVG